MTLLQEFEAPVSDGATTYRAYLHGRDRDDGMWEAWIVFERSGDRARFATPVETTQSSVDAVVYWATGLSTSYFEGALRRAIGSRAAAQPAPPDAPPLPVVDAATDAHTRRRRLGTLELEILDFFRRLREPRLLTQALFDGLPHANADIVRALEDLEKQGRLLVRRTEEGNDWLFLSEAGLREAGLSDVPHHHDEVEIDPPKSVR